MNLIDLFFPKACLECRLGGSYICEACLQKVTFPKLICPECQRASIDGITHVKCKAKYGLDGLVTLWRYQGVVRRAIISLKYKYATDVGSELARYILKFLPKYLVALPKRGVFTPIPLYWYRENYRGFNQSEQIGRDVAEKFDWMFISGFLIRKKLSTPQVSLKGKERMKNIKGVFAVSPNISISQYPNIILFDDVYTTGSTLKEACRTLKKGGAKQVWGLTIAR